MISNSQLFFLGRVKNSDPNQIRMYKITFASTSPDWAIQMQCGSDYWYSQASESILSSDGTKIYLFFIMSASDTNLYFSGLSVSDGSVTTTRYKSSVVVSDVRGAALNGDYIVATTYTNFILIYRISTSTFTINSFSFDLYGWAVEPSSGR